jgi:FtsH-binding integral membrane protein
MVNPNLYNTLWKIRQGGGITKDISKLLFEKRDFLVKTFANLIFQALITFYAMKKYVKDKPNRYVTIVVYIYIIATILILALVPLPTWLKLVLFSIFSYGWGYCLAGFSDTVGEAAIHSAIVGTLSIFGIMFAIGFMMLVTGIQLGFKTGILLFFSLLLLLLSTLFNLFYVSASLATILTILGIFLFAIYILYDTNIILQKNYSGDFITASIDYYLDILNLFVNIMSLDRS